MNPYLFTLVFLMLMGMLTSSEVLRFSQNHIGNELHIHYTKSLTTKEAFNAVAELEEFRKYKPNGEKEKKKLKLDEEIEEPAAPKVVRSTSMKFNFSRPPNNARLNLYTLLHETPHKDYPLSLYEAIASLMRHLYEETRFFREIPQLEYQILDKLIELKEETRDFIYPDELGGLSFDDAILQTLFCRMLKGSEGKPSLLNYITFDKEGSIHQKKVNLMFAPPEVIYALLDNPLLSQELINLRDTIWVKVIDEEEHRLERPKDQCKGRAGFKKELNKGYERIIDEFGLKSKNYNRVFDRSLGKFGNILFIEDSQTGFMRREKYIKSSSRPKKL